MAVQDRDYIEVWRKAGNRMREKNITISERTFCTEDTISAVVETAKTRDTMVSGKQINKLPFSSCMDSVKCFGEIYAEQIYLFVREGGTLTEGAEQRIAECFLASEEKDRVVLVYADEDYAGSLQELYGMEEGCFDAAVTVPYQHSVEKGDVYYRGLPWFKPDFSPDTLASFSILAVCLLFAEM